jgi:hypothetical protein
VARTAKNANRFAFLGTLGLNASSAILNMTQVPMIVLPYLAGSTDFPTAYNALTTGYKVFVASPRHYRTHNYLHTEEYMETIYPGAANILSKSLPNYYQTEFAPGGKGTGEAKWKLRDDMEFDDTVKIYKGYTQKQLLTLLAPLARQLHTEGQDNRSLFYENLEVFVEGYERASVTDKVSMIAAYAFHHAERMNRQVTSIGAFLNELHRLETSPSAKNGEVGLTKQQREERALANASDITLQTNGGATLPSAPRYAQKNIGRVALMFKTYGIGMMYHMGRTALNTLKAVEPDPELRKIARKQLGYTLGTVFLSAGVAGLPGYSALMAVLDLLFTDDDDEEGDMDTQVRKFLHEGLYSGWLNQATKVLGGEGLAISHRIGLNNIILQTNRYNFDPSIEKDIVTLIGGPFYGYLSSIMRGLGDISEGEYQRGVEAILPAGIRNPMKAIRYMDEGTLTRRLDPVTGELGAGMLLGQFLGFAPAEYMRNQEKSQIAKGIDIATNARRSRIMKQMFLASRVGDAEAMSDLMEELQDYNSDHPTNAIETDDLMSSITSHYRTSPQMMNGVLISPKMRAVMQELVKDI